MPFTIVELIRSSELKGVGDYTFTYADDAEFVEPFTFNLERVDGNTGKDDLRAKAISIVEAERQRRAAIAIENNELLTFMNEVK